MSVGIVCVVIPQVYYTPQEDQKVYYIICTSRSNPSNPRRIQKQQNVSSLIWSGCAIWLWTFIYSIERTVGWRMYRKKELLLLPLQRYSERSTTTEIFPSPKKKKKKKFFTILKINLYFQKGKTSWIDEDEFLAGSTLIAQFFFQRLPIRSFFHLRSVKEKRKEEENYSLSNML